MSFLIRHPIRHRAIPSYWMEPGSRRQQKNVWDSYNHVRNTWYKCLTLNFQPHLHKDLHQLLFDYMGSNTPEFLSVDLETLNQWHSLIDSLVDSDAQNNNHSSFNKDKSLEMKLITGPRGGQYYIVNGNKKYVAKNSRLPRKGTRLTKTTVVGEKHVRSWSPKENRQYEHILQSELEEGRSEKRAKSIAAATVNKNRSRKKTKK